MPEQERKAHTILKKKDLNITWFSGGAGAGGQYRNKHDNCCRIRHEESGAFSQSTEHRSQEANLKLAFKRLCEHPKMRVWINKKVYEINNSESIEESVDKLLAPKYIEILVKNAEGQWVKVKEEDLTK